MDSENNNRIELPTEEQLAKLSLPKIQWYASRNALRALQFCAHKSIDSGWLEKYLVTICVAALVGQCVIKQDSRAARRVAAHAAAVRTDTYATNYSAYAADVADAIIYADADADADADAVRRAARASRIRRVASVDATHAAVDYQSLLNKENYHSLPLWHDPEVFQNDLLSRQWFSLLKKYKLQDVADIYHSLLKGNANTVSKTQAFLMKRAGFTKDDFLSDELANEPDNKTKHATHTAEGATTDDFLGRKPLAKAMARLLSNKDNTKSLIIGLFGDWGAGKSSLLNMLKQQLKNKPKNNIFEAIKSWLSGVFNKDKHNTLTFKTNEFNAWSYEHTDNIQAGVAQEAIKGLTTNLCLIVKPFVALRLNWRTQRAKLLVNCSILMVWVSFVLYGLLN